MGASTKEISDSGMRPSDVTGRARPSSRISDIWKAPFHDLPIREDLIYQYLPRWEGMELMEIGPGSGFAAFRLAREGPRVTMVEYPSAGVERLEATLRHERNLRFVCADLSRPGLAEKAGRNFDAVFGLAVFDLIPNPAICLENLCSVLKPGGELMLQFPNYPPPLAPGIIHFRTRKELDDLLRHAGFRSWNVYGLALRPHAQLLYDWLHEAPLHVMHRVRRYRKAGQATTFENTWSFRQGRKLDKLKSLIHAAWALQFALIRLGGPCFQRELLGNDIFSRNLLLTATV